jgi:pimeloyl-ACP methyl ester carboxylesterase
MVGNLEQFLMEEGLITLDGSRLFVRHHQASNSSERPTVVFLHEALGSVGQWKDFPEAVAALLDTNLLNYDRLGHGRSDPVVKKKIGLFCITKPGRFFRLS